MREESRQGVLLYRLDFAPQLGERFPTDLAQDFCVTPFTMQATGAEAALKNPTLLRQKPKRILDDRGIERKTMCGVSFREWAMGPSISTNKLKNRLRHGLHERGRKSGWERDPKGIAITRCIFSGNQTSFSGDAQLEQPARTDKPVNRFEQGLVDHAKRKLVAR